MTKNISETADFITFKNSSGVGARGNLLKISRNQIIFETYNPYSIVQLSEVLSNLTICKFSEKVYVGKAVVSNLINTGLLLVVSATLVDPWLEDLKSNQIINVEDEAKKFILEWHHINDDAFPTYQLIVNKIRSFLVDVNRWVRQFDLVKNNIKSDYYNDENLIKRISDPILSSLSELFFKFELEVQKIDQNQIDLCKRFAQQELHPLMMQSPFAHRTFHKPLGYAGDYEMVNMMFRDRYEGETTYAKLLNSFLLGPGPAEAHRNRIDILYNKIKEVAEKSKIAKHRAKIFNFACGPALELQKFIEQEEISENCDFILLDFSKETLDYTSETLKRIIKQKNRHLVGIRTIHKSVNDILRNAVGLKDKDSEETQSFDLIYCAGLFDYLSDRVCAKMLNLFFSQLHINGTLIATNVHSNNPAKGLMEHLLDWYLVYRNESKFSELMPQDNKIIYVDKTGFNIFLEVKKVSQ